MASKRTLSSARTLWRCTDATSRQWSRMPTSIARSLTTEASSSAAAPTSTIAASEHYNSINSSTFASQSASNITESATLNQSERQRPQPYQPPPNPFLTTAQCTLYDFPSFEPRQIVEYPSTHLLLPTRKDLLHRAVIFEGDATRQGTASTKWRREVHGSTRKIRPQKGTGGARLGDKKSPMLKGGGVAFGPKPRDFSTDLPAKIYDRAFRTALSYRFRQGQLLITEGSMILPVDEGSAERYFREALKWNDLDDSLFVTSKARTGQLEKLSGIRSFRLLTQDLVDVKDLLKGRRLVIERQALEFLLKSHERDLAPEARLR